MKISALEAFARIPCAKNRSFLPSLLTGLLLLLTDQLTAQTVTRLYNFSGTPSIYPYTNNDGANPQAGLLLLDHTLFGAASGGGTAGNGALFRIDTDGTGFTNLHNFSDSGLYSTNTDGYGPVSALVSSGNVLFGTANLGG